MTALPHEYFITVQPGVNNVNHIFENITDNATSISASVWADNDNIRPVSKSINSKV